jgi:hypothetical protein
MVLFKSRRMNIHSHKTQLIATAVGASLATAGLLTAYNSYTKRERRKNLNNEIFRSIASSGSSTDIKSYAPTPPLEVVQPTEGFKYDEDLIREQLARNYAFFGDEGMSKIRRGRVVIVGCGGVGSWAAVMLARS